MQLQYRPDFDSVKQRWDVFWKGGQDLVCPMISVHSPRSGMEEVRKPDGCVGMQGDYEAVARQAIGWAESHYFLGDAIPFICVQFGPDHFAGLLGAELKYTPQSSETTWCVPFVDDWKTADLRFKRDGAYWRRTVEAIESLRKLLDDKILVAGPCLQSGLDALSAVRGSEKLMMDLMTEPETIKAVLDKVSEARFQVDAELRKILDIKTRGTITRHGMYCSGAIDILQCDVSAMISPDMFEEFALPTLRREAASLDVAEYHLDGPDAVRHLDAVCSVDHIGVIQWQPGAGNAATQDWSRLYHRIDDLGKGMVLFADHAKMRRMWKEHRTRKIFFRTGAASEEEGRKILEGW